MLYAFGLAWFNELLAWLLSNKEWVFSGIGVVILAGLVSGILRIIRWINVRRIGGTAQASVEGHSAADKVDVSGKTSEPKMDDSFAAQSGVRSGNQVTLGDIPGGIHGSMIAGGDVINSTLNFVNARDQDEISDIEEKFSAKSEESLRRIRVTISGIADTLPRDELVQIEEQINQGKPVLIVGEAGTGKSGLVVLLAQNSRLQNKILLYIDARNLSGVTNEKELREYFDLVWPLRRAIVSVGKHLGCCLVIDQLDSVIGLNIHRLLIDLALVCSTSEGVNVILVSRARENDEQRLFDVLNQAGFIRLVVRELRTEIVADILGRLAINTTSELLELGANLLNLELIATIKSNVSDYDFAEIKDEVHLWENYLQAIKDREPVNLGQEIVSMAMEFATQALQEGKNQITLDYLNPTPVERMISWGIIFQYGGLVHQFKHEKLRDYLYALRATDLGKMPTAVLADNIDPHYARNIFIWMDKIYKRMKSPYRRQFLKEMWDVKQ